ncbi:MAG TPA: MFS transporter, partial [Ilumatobacteraceae bacterium]|nr:MFS transporter [Ilumatobacteraceae bacterium]
RQTFVNDMVDRRRLTNAVGLNSASFNLARMIGPAVAGWLIAAAGSGARATGWVILLNAASYAAVVISLFLIRASELDPVPRLVAAKGQLIEGVRYVRHRADIMMVLAIVFCAGTFGFNFQMTTALMATEVYDKGAGEYGNLGSILAVGSLVGSLFAARRVVTRQRLVVVAGVVFGGIEMIAGLMPSYLTFALLLPLCGVTALTMVTAANAYVQTATDAVVRGRVMALYMMIFMGGTPLGAPALGWVSDHFGARWTLIGGGLLTAVGTLAAAAFFGPRQGVSASTAWHAGPRLLRSVRQTNETVEEIASV